MIIKKNIFLSVLLALMMLLPLSCGKDGRHPVPDVMVNFTLNLESTQYIELNVVGGWAYFTGGYRGIIIYRQSIDEFRAFDRACPYHPYDDCALIRVFDPPLATDTCCGSRFLLIDGSVVTGPSEWPLKQYRTFFNPPFLQVSNW
jgi:hypothetical protein